MSSDWDKEDDQDKEKDQTQPEASSDSFIRPTQILKPPKPYVSKYFDSMSSGTPIIYTPKEKQRCDTIIAQEECKTTECKYVDQDSLEEID